MGKKDMKQLLTRMRHVYQQCRNIAVLTGCLVLIIVGESSHSGITVVLQVGEHRADLTQSLVIGQLLLLLGIVVLTGYTVEDVLQPVYKLAKLARIRFHSTVSRFLKHSPTLEERILRESKQP